MIKNVIVSGACGFVGRHLIKALIANNWQIIALDLNKQIFDDFLLNNNLVNNHSIKFFQVDFTDKQAIKSIISEIPDNSALVHLAGYILSSSAGINDYDSLKAYQVNKQGSADLVDILKPKLNKVIAASTLDVYGFPRVLPITEAHPLNPETVYAGSKLDMEKAMIESLKDKVQLTILRFSHIYGKDDPHNKVLKSFAAAVMNDQSPIIYGDGEDQRDHIHVKDIAEAIICALKSPISGVFNVASGISYSFNQLVAMIIDCSGKDLNPEYRKSVNPRKDYVFDISKLEKEIQFKPKISMSEGIAELLS